MFILQDQVMKFHHAMKQTIGDPREPNVTISQEFRLKLIREELKELEDALAINDVADVADALGDMMYVIAGAAITWGIDMAPVMDEIHRSNMTKTPDNKREDGKVMKGPNYYAPDIRGVLAQQVEDFSDTDNELIGDPEECYWATPTAELAP